MMKMRIWRRKI